MLDAVALSASLAVEPDVSGNAQQGWQRLAKDADGVQRSRTSVNPGRAANRIELLHRTQRLADEGRAWPGSSRWPRQPCST